MKERLLDARAAIILAGVAENDDGELETFRLMDGEDGDATLGEGVIGILVLRLAKTEKGEEKGIEEDVRDGIFHKEVGSDDSDVLLHEAGEILGDETEIADGTFILLPAGAAARSNICLKKEKPQRR